MTAPQPEAKFRDARRAIGLLRIYATLILVALPVQIWARFRPDDLPTAIQLVTILPLGLVQLLAIGQFGAWFHAAYSKLRVVGAPTRYTPSMALVLFFVPFANLFRPSELIAELYQGFEPTRLREGSRRRPQGSRAAALWWYGLLASSIAADIATAITLRDKSAELTAVTFVLVTISQILAAFAALGATRFVNDVRELQRRCAILLRLDGKRDAGTVLEGDSFRPTERIAQTLGGLLIVSAILQALFTLIVITAVWDAGYGLMVRPVASVLLLVVVLTVIAFLMWLRRTVSNLRRVRSFPVTPGFAIGGLFIPGFNLVHPWLVVQRIWRCLDEIRVAQPTVHGPLTLPDAPVPRSTLVDAWGVSTILQFLTAWVVRWSGEWGEELRPVVQGMTVGNLLFSVVTTLLLQQIVTRIGRRMAPLERGIASARNTAIAGVGSAPVPVPRKAAWSEVLLPIAASIDEGLREDTPEARRERERTELARDALKEIENDRTFQIREVFFPTRVNREELSDEALEQRREQKAAERAREAQEAIQRARRRVTDSKFSSAWLLTGTVRVLLLLALFVGAAECSYVFSAVALMRIVRVTPLLMFGAMSCVLLIGAMLCGLPSWLVLSQWAVVQLRNGNSCGALATDPIEGRLRILTLREPDLFRELFAASGAPFSDAGFDRWMLALRMVQTAPAWLAVALVAGPVIAMGAVGLLALTLVFCLTETANYVRAINVGFERMHRDRTEAVQRQATVPA